MNDRVRIYWDGVVLQVNEGKLSGEKIRHRNKIVFFGKSQIMKRQSASNSNKKNLHYMESYLYPKEKLISLLLERETLKEGDVTKMVVPAFLAKKIVSLMLIKCDLNHVVLCANEIIKLGETEVNNKLVEKSLFHSLVVTYAKCFNSNEGGYGSLNKKDLFDESNEGILEIHENIIQLRNEFIAHRDDTENEQATVFINLPKATDEFYLTISAAVLQCPSNENIRNYLPLFNFLMSKVDEKIKKQADKVTPAFFRMINEIGNKYLPKFVL